MANVKNLKLCLNIFTRWKPILEKFIHSNETLSYMTIHE